VGHARASLIGTFSVLTVFLFYVVVSAGCCHS